MIKDLRKKPEDIDLLRQGGHELAKILAEVSTAARPGITTNSLDLLARELISKIGGKPSFLNYRPIGASRPFPAALCVSVNDEVVHGLPSERCLKDGDLVSLDLGLNFHGFYTDMAVTVAVGVITPPVQSLLEVTKGSLLAGINVVRSGATTGDIGSAITRAVRRAGDYGIVTDLGGHGVGYRVHEPPDVPNVGKQGEGVKLMAGMVIAIEPMVVLGSGEVITAKDGWTVKTREGGLAAHFEHTILVSENGSEILTI